MIIDLILFPVFLCFLHILGAGSLKWVNYRNTDNYPDYFYIISGLLTLGFISVCVNFYSGIYIKPTYYIISLIFLIGIYSIYRNNSKPLKTVILLGIALTPLAATINAGYDSGLYHLPHQLWIRNEKIVFGLANFNNSLGYSSIMEFINAPLWVDHYFNLLAYSLMSFIIVLLLFVRSQIESSNTQIKLTGLLFLLTLIFYASKFRTDYTSTDIPMGVLFATTFFYGLNLLLENKPLTTRDISIAFILVLFTATLKANGILIGIWILFVLVWLLKNKLLKYSTLLKAAILPTILGVIWLIRAIITSGCLIFPVAQTCLDLPWTAYNKAIKTSNIITAWARHKNSDLSSLNNWDWVTGWWWERNSKFLLFILAISIAIPLIYRFFMRRPIAYPKHAILPAALFILMGLAVWFLKAPTPRFGIGTFIILPTILTLLCFGFRGIKNNKTLTAACKIFFTTLILEFLILGIVESKLDFSFYPLTINDIETIPDTKFGTKPANPESDQCWLAPYCSPNNKSSIIEQDGLKMFIEEK